MPPVVPPAVVVSVEPEPAVVISVEVALLSVYVMFVNLTNSPESVICKSASNPAISGVVATTLYVVVPAVTL